MCLRHVRDNAFDQGRACRDQLFSSHRLGDHTLETRDELGRDILGTHGQHLGHGPVVAEQIDDEGGAQPIVDALVGEQIADVEQVPRMLAIEGGDDLPA